jgi:hypothetical protein
VGGASSTSTPHIRVHSWFKTPPREVPSGQISGWKARATCIRGSFVVHSASGGVSPLVTALTSVLWLQPQRRAAPSPSGETELSWYPRHATAVDGDSDLPLPHPRDATTLLCSTAYDDNWAESELRTQ